MLLFSVLIFLVALFALISAMHRGVAHKADARLSEQFSAEGSSGEASRALMHASGYGV